MTAVVISRALTADLGWDNAVELAKDFKAYKADPENRYGDIFGRDKKFLFPDIVSRNALWHVHMEEPSVESDWQSHWDQQDPQYCFTSDKILVYGKMENVSFTPYLLLTILSPKGHALMADIDGMKALGQEYEDEVFAYSAKLPTDKWVFEK
ncbi:MAG: hypothetical protein EOP02_04240 [Proteobacteria bacterium]|nr:MAG: hypothetical protein EOP02_04240 [Pseudomonadota bacterium]